MKLEFFKKKKKKRNNKPKKNKFYIYIYIGSGLYAVKNLNGEDFIKVIE
jgi:hypothetical protein